MTDTPLLAVTGLRAWYDESHVLDGVEFDVHPGEVVTLLGRNGAGKTTTLRALMGLLAKREGRALFDGKDLIGMRSDHIARAGIGYCPEERGIFSTLSVKENLELPPRVAAGGLSQESIYELFPNLSARRDSQGTKLSGGEQQMLAIARILRTGARMLLLDEVTEGLAPVIIKEIGRTILELKKRGFTILLVEQNLKFAQSVADRHCIMELGRIVDTVPAGEYQNNIGKLNRYLGI